MSARERQRSFHLGSLPAGAGLDPIVDRGLIPALAARYRDLSALRYDYPVVLLQDPREGEFFRPLSSIIDDVLREAAAGDDADRIASHVLALEGRQHRVRAPRPVREADPGQPEASRPARGHQQGSGR